MLPEIVSGPESEAVEIVFRGITEGEFSLRGPEYTFRNVAPSDIHPTQPPFDGTGPFSRAVGDHIDLIGRPLGVGPFTVLVRQAEVADPSLIERIGEDSTTPRDVRVAALDHQVTFRFERYASEPPAKRAQRLNSFKEKLSREEPLELVELVDSTLQDEVSADEAVQIAFGWQSYNSLPDRYCLQEPVLDPEAGCWRIPIHLVYAGGEGGLVGEIRIDVQTGEVIHHTPVEELRSRGLEVAERTLQVR